MPHVTMLYAGLLGLLSIAIAAPAGQLRAKLNVPVGDGGYPELLVASRRHGNFAEWVPLALILIAELELNGVSYLAIHGLGAALLVSRIAHFFGLKSDTIRKVNRLIGAMGTMLVTLIASVWAVVAFFVK